jgi:UDP-N-acetylmuramyl pentapeptide phosphotransferase/UDP-N-acetylglucosamine-1-phosphate transferase
MFPERGVIIAGGAFLLTWLSLAALLRFGVAHRLAIDEPNARSLHTVPTPRIGGLVAVPIALAGWLAASSFLWQFAALAACLSLLSYVDDRTELPVVVRFGAHLAAAGAAAVLLLPGVPLWAVGAAVFAIAWITNLYNFMDGADGMAGGMAVVGFGAYAVAAVLAGAPDLAVPPLMIAAAAGGFLMLNFPPAKVFMGDAGSIPLGFLAGALGLAGIAKGLWPWWFPLLVFSPFVVDATLTLLRRALRGERVWRAHREHAYQKLVRSGWSHRRLLAAEWPLMAAAAATALALRTSPAVLSGLILAAAAYAALLWAVEIRWRKCGTPGR